MPLALGALGAAGAMLAAMAPGAPGFRSCLSLVDLRWLEAPRQLAGVS